MSIKSLSTPRVDAGLLLLRLGSGLSLLLIFGLPKIKDAMSFIHTGHWSFVDFNRNVGLPAPVLVAYLQTVNESVIAFLLACGFMARLAASCLSCGFAIATLCSIKAHEDWYPAAYFCLMFVTLLLTGPGKLSVDRWLQSKFKTGNICRQEIKMSQKERYLIALILITCLLRPWSAEVRAQEKSPKPQVEEGYVTSANGVRLFYRTIGNGPDFIVFLHGGPGLSMGDGGYAMVPLGDQHTLILYDQRGGGRSDLVKDPALLTAAADVLDLETLRRHFRIEKMSLIGLSWGSGLAALYAKKHPESVSRIVFLDPMPIALTPYSEEREQKISSLISAEDQTRLDELDKESSTANDQELIDICREETRITFKPYLFTSVNHDTDWSEMCNVPPAALKKVPAVNTAVTESLGKFDLRPTLASLRMPILVIEGEKTNVPLDSTREWARAVPGGRLLLIPNAGHATFVDQPKILLEVIAVFLGGKWPIGAKDFARGNKGER